MTSSKKGNIIRAPEEAPRAGGDVKLHRDDAIRVLTRLRNSVLKEAQELAKAGELPAGNGGWQLWVLDREEELTVLEDCLERYRKLPPGEFIGAAEGTAL